jgi:ubiquinone/menaquinone biosynthesis C-methylase UbiE
MKFTGEFFIPPNADDANNNNSELEIEHKQRYLSIVKLVEGKTVLDIACGEGYGAHILSSKARLAVGVDINPDLVEHAGRKYKQENLRYLRGSVERIPLESDSVDIVISFETMEHVDAEIQLQFVMEVKRVLKADGVFIVSTPNKKNYTDRYNHHNSFHIHELNEDAFTELLTARFGHVRLYHQGLEVSSLILNKEDYLLQKPVTMVPVSKDAYHFESKYLIGLCSDLPEAIATSIASIVPESEKSYFQLIDRILQLQREVEELGAWGTRSSAEVEALSKEKAALELSAARSEGEVKTLTEEVKTLTEEAKTLTEEAKTLTEEVAELTRERTALIDSLGLARKNINYYSDVIRKMQEDLARSNHKAFLLEAELQALQKIHISTQPPSFGLEELTTVISNLNESIARDRKRDVRPVSQGQYISIPASGPSPDQLKQQISQLEQDIAWYKKTYKERSFLGTIRQKISDSFHK